MTHAQFFQFMLNNFCGITVTFDYLKQDADVPLFHKVRIDQVVVVQSTNDINLLGYDYTRVKTDSSEYHESYLILCNLHNIAPQGAFFMELKGYFYARTGY